MSGYTESIHFWEDDKFLNSQEKKKELARELAVRILCSSISCSTIQSEDESMGLDIGHSIVPLVIHVE